MTHKLLDKKITTHYVYDSTVHQVGYQAETFFSTLLGTTVVVIADEDGISVSLMDGTKVVGYTTFGRRT